MGYCTVQDVKDIGLPEEALEELTDAQIQEQIDTVQGVIDVYISRYDLPLQTPYPDFLKRVNIDLAVCEIFLYRGYNPEEGNDQNYSARCERWLGMLDDIASGNLNIPGIIDETPTVNESAPKVKTSTLRGW